MYPHKKRIISKINSNMSFPSCPSQNQPESAAFKLVLNKATRNNYPQDVDLISSDIFISYVLQIFLWFMI